jgi:hypothetical protein
MPAFGGFTPFPLRLGGGRPNVEVIFNGLAADRGTAVDAKDLTKSVGIETLATARLLAATWATNERLGYCWDPLRCDMVTLARWEKFLALTPSVDDTDSARRARVAKLFKRFGRAVTKAYVAELLTREIPDAFVAVDSIGYSYAITRNEVHVPDGTYPDGTVLAGYPFTSSVSRVLIRLTFPTGWSLQDFYEAVGKIYTTLDPVLPCWATIDWYSNNGPNYVDLSPEGPSGAGFFLDQPHNLDGEIFDV